MSALVVETFRVNSGITASSTDAASAIRVQASADARGRAVAQFSEVDGLSG